MEVRELERRMREYANYIIDCESQHNKEKEMTESQNCMDKFLDEFNLEVHTQEFCWAEEYLDKFLYILENTGFSNRELIVLLQGVNQAATDINEQMALSVPKSNSCHQSNCA